MLFFQPVYCITALNPASITPEYQNLQPASTLKQKVPVYLAQALFATSIELV